MAKHTTSLIAEPGFYSPDQAIPDDQDPASVTVIPHDEDGTGRTNNVLTLKTFLGQTSDRAPGTITSSGQPTPVVPEPRLSGVQLSDKAGQTEAGKTGRTPRKRAAAGTG